MALNRMCFLNTTRESMKRKTSMELERFYIVLTVRDVITHVLICFSALQIHCLSYMYIHLQVSSPSADILPTRNVTGSQLASVDSSFGRARHRYRRRHGSESRSGLNLFQDLITAMSNHVFRHV